MAGSVSPATGRAYGVARVCKVWGMPRSSFHHSRREARDPAPARPKGRRGPKPAIPDAALLEAIRTDLASSPWSGEGHRKVWARLRVPDGHNVARKRVLRWIARAHPALAAPPSAAARLRARPQDRHRRAERDVGHRRHPDHDPARRQGLALRHGGALERRSPRMACEQARHPPRGAFRATSMAVRQQFGHLGRDAARGVRLRHDHGSCFMADDFQTRIRAWGMTPSFAFIGQPETNGVVERFFRTLKEQIVHGRVHETIEDVREAVRAFIARYNAEWLVEKNGSLSPFALRRQHELAAMPMAA